MLAMTAFGLAVLPDHALIAVHFGPNGAANGWMTKARALLTAPALAAAFTAFFALWPRISRSKDGLRASAAAYVTGWLGSLVVLFVGQCIVVFVARGVAVDVAGTLILMPALLFLFLGSVLGKTRPNGLVGVRTPWTRKSDLSWDKTNRLAGRLLAADGLATLAALALGGAVAAHAVLIAGIVVLCVITIPLSRHYWQIDPNRRP
jgi:Predicted integral membrane protein